MMCVSVSIFSPLPYPSTLFVAPGDYTAISPPQSVTFSSAPNMMCFPIFILNDNVVEVTEFFTVTLETTDRAVQFTQQSANVTIMDSTGRHLLSLGFYK